MKEKFLYLVNKVKELLGFGDPIVSIDMNGAEKLETLSKAYVYTEGDNVAEEQEDKVETEDKGGVEFVSPTQKAQSAMKDTKNNNTE